MISLNRANKNPYTNDRYNNKSVKFGSGEKLENFLIENQTLHKAYKLAEGNPALFKATLSLIISLTLKPAGILAVPGAKKEDKKYMAAKTIAGGFAGFLFTATIFSRIGGALARMGYKDAFGDFSNIKPYISKLPPEKQEVFKKNFKGFNQLVNQGFEVVLAPLQMSLMIMMVPKVVKIIFPDKDKSRKLSPNKSVEQTLAKTNTFDNFAGRKLK